MIPLPVRVRETDSGQDPGVSPRSYVGGGPSPVFTRLTHDTRTRLSLICIMTCAQSITRRDPPTGLSRFDADNAGRTPDTLHSAVKLNASLFLRLPPPLTVLSLRAARRPVRDSQDIIRHFKSILTVMTKQRYVFTPH